MHRVDAGRCESRTDHVEKSVLCILHYILTYSIKLQSCFVFSVLYATKTPR